MFEVIAASSMMMARVEMEAEYQKLCAAAKAAGVAPPSRESYFGPVLKTEEPVKQKDGDWWSLGLGILIGSMFG